MEIEVSEEELRSLAQEKIVLGANLLQRLETFKGIEGVTKIERKILQEIKFLKKVVSTNQLKINHISCSNLVHFNYLVAILSQTSDVQSLDYPVKVGGNRKSTGRIDIVSDKGCTWMKVIARNPKALSDIVSGQASYGTKSILDHAENYIQAAEDNPCLFKAPKIIFDFANDISEDLKASLVEMGICVRVNGKCSVEEHPQIENITKLNLDITTLLTYVSAQANGSVNWEFKEPLLTEQAYKERRNPVKPFLENLFQGKELIICETAAKDFVEIVNTLGGKNEKNRTEQFMLMLKVLPDVTQEEQQSLAGLAKLSINGKIKPRSFQIFAFGMHHRAITVTSNEGFIRSAKMQGLEIPSIVHEARYLTEAKEPSAKEIAD